MNSSLDIWILLYSILFMNINWEVERLQRVLFAQTWEMQAANDLKYKQKTDYNISQSTIQRLEESSGNERRVAENEKNQLRSMVSEKFKPLFFRSCSFYYYCYISVKSTDVIMSPLNCFYIIDHRTLLIFFCKPKYNNCLWICLPDG